MRLLDGCSRPRVLVVCLVSLYGDIWAAVPFCFSSCACLPFLSYRYGRCVFFCFRPVFACRLFVPLFVSYLFIVSLRRHEVRGGGRCYVFVSCSCCRLFACSLYRACGRCYFSSSFRAHAPFACLYENRPVRSFCWAGRLFSLLILVAGVHRVFNGHRVAVDGV